MGLATARLLASRGATVYILDQNQPRDADLPLPASVTYIPCDVTNWSQQVAAFEQAGPQIDLAVACAGMGEGAVDYFADSFDASGKLLDPPMATMDVNYGGVLKFVKLAVSCMRRSGRGGSVVVVASATAYSPEIGLPVYSSLKAAVGSWGWWGLMGMLIVGIRFLRSYGVWHRRWLKMVLLLMLLHQRRQRRRCCPWGWRRI
jgi:NAD(P)-dependent dehydrogenase (short-subunit alcohol dehydrogenase family)